MAAKAYEVIKKDPMRRLNRVGEAETVWRITAVSNGGTTFPLEIPDAELDQAEDRLTKKARQLDAIS